MLFPWHFKHAQFIAVEVSLAHLLSGKTAILIHGWVGQKETIIHALCFHPHYLVQAMSYQLNRRKA